MMEVIALIVSIFALIISIGVPVIEYARDYRINRINLESEYFKEIYKEHLVSKLPKARNYITFDASKKLIGTDNLINELQELLVSSLYFKYTNETFYKNLKDKIQALEDYLVGNTGIQFSNQNQANVYKNINKYMEDIYKMISDAYLGKKK